MAKIDPELRRRLQAKPDAHIHAIIRTQRDPAQAAISAGQRGVTVRRQFTLVPGLAVTGPASALLSLLDEPWVASIEEDREVHTMTHDQ